MQILLPWERGMLGMLFGNLTRTPSWDRCSFLRGEGEMVYKGRASKTRSQPKNEKLSNR